MTKSEDLRKYIIHCIVQRFSTKEALSYLKAHDFPLAESTYFEYKKKIKEQRFSRMRELADTGYIDYHLDALDTLEWVKKEMVANYHIEQDPYKRVEILTQITNTLSFFDGYLSETKGVMERKAIKNTEAETTTDAVF